MTPASNIDLENLEVKEVVDSDFRLGDKIIVGKVDGLEHLKQTIFWLLNTERYEYIIYDWNIGLETNDLYGMPVDYVCSELEYRIQDALSIDERIEEIYDFSFDTSQRGIILCQFKVISIYGEFTEEKEVYF